MSDKDKDFPGEEELREFMRRHGPPAPDAQVRFDRLRFERELANVPRQKKSTRTGLWIGTTAAVAALLVAAAFFRPAAHAPTPPAPGAVSSGTPPVLAAPVTVPAHLTSVDFLTPTDGWVVGWNRQLLPSTVLHTTDGGRTWSSATVKGYALTHISFQNPEDGWAIGTTQCNGSCQPDTVLRTTDGGKTWHQALAFGVPASGGTNSSPTQNGIVGMQGMGTGDALVLGRSALMVTADGGTNWTQHALPSGLTGMALAFTSPTNGYVVADQSCPQAARTCPVEVLHTTDGGATWTKVFTTSQPSSGSQQFAFLSFPDASHGWLYVGNLATWQGQVFATANGGKAWTLVQKTFNAVRPSVAAFTFTTDTTGWVALDQGAGPIGGGIRFTTDGGATWTYVGQERNWSIADVSVDGTGGVWAVSDQPNGANFLVHSTDGGRTWTQVLPGPAPTSDVSFFASGQGYGLGLPSDPQAILSTKDGGKTWDVVGRLPLQNPGSISFATPLVGYATGNVPSPSSDAIAIDKTTDGGRTWKTVGADNITPDVPATLPFLKAFANGHVLAETEVFPTTRVWKGTPAGLSKAFSIKAPPASWSLFSFPTETDGFYAVYTSPKSQTMSGASTGVTLSATTDGGRTWTRLHRWPQTDWPLGLDFTSPSHGYILLVAHPFTTHPSDELYVTNDGGRTFSLVTKLPTPVQNLNGDSVRLQFTDATHGWMLAANGLLRTTDGGKTWHLVP